MLRVHQGDFVPQYESGKWIWNESEESIQFLSNMTSVQVNDHYMKTGGFKFLCQINQIEEMIFRQEFQRSELSHDADVILIQDIKNLVLFLAPVEMTEAKFLRFVHTATVDQFLHALLIYFEHYIKLVEFVLIRRDEVSDGNGQLQSQESIELKRIYSAHLTQYRLLLAREYSNIILGAGEMKPFYHIRPIVKISQSIADKRFHEQFLAFCTQIIWISQHRRAYDVIDSEMNRLFRSDHFKLTLNERVRFSRAEASMLYGKNYRRVNYRAQNSPLIQELANVDDENLPLLWVGKRKYRGTDLRILQVELEYIVPASQLVLVDVPRGILGHPKKLYDTMLTINWPEVRLEHYSTDYDPYHIWRMPSLKLPALDAEKIRKNAETYEYYYNIITTHESIAKNVFLKWRKRDKIVNYFKTEGMITSIWIKSMNEVNDTGYGPTVEEITAAFKARKEKLRKN